MSSICRTSAARSSAQPTRVLQLLSECPLHRSHHGQEPGEPLNGVGRPEVALTPPHWRSAPGRTVRDRLQQKELPQERIFCHYRSQQKRCRSTVHQETKCQATQPTGGHLPELFLQWNVVQNKPSSFLLFLHEIGPFSPVRGVCQWLSP